MRANLLRRNAQPFNSCERLQVAVEQEHNCRAVPVVSMPVNVTRGKASWRGLVEAFDLESHHSAKRCYAWFSSRRGRVEVVSVLKLPPISSAEEAVRAWLVPE